MQRKNFRAILVIGDTGTGKSTWIKKRVSLYNGPKLIYDPNKEYKDGIMLEMDDFLELAVNRRDSLILFEDATAFISNKSDDKKIKKILSFKRHDNNTIFLVFHSLQAIPSYIYTLCDLLVLFHTKENEALIYKKLSANVDIYSAFVELKRERSRYAYKMINLRPGN